MAATPTEIYRDLERVIDPIIDELENDLAAYLQSRGQPAPQPSPQQPSPQQPSPEPAPSGGIGPTPSRGPGGRPTWMWTPGEMPGKSSPGRGRRGRSEGTPQYNPRWKGLRGLLRWLWKGHSRDNPDYSQLYGDESPREQPRKAKWDWSKGLAQESLQSYNGYHAEINALANEIIETVVPPKIEVDDALEAIFRKFKASLKITLRHYADTLHSRSPATPGAETKDALDVTDDEYAQSFAGAPKASTAPVVTKGDKRRQSLEQRLRNIEREEIREPQSEWFAGKGFVSKNISNLRILDVLRWLISKNVNITNEVEVQKALETHLRETGQKVRPIRGNVLQQYLDILRIDPDDEEAVDRVLRPLGWTRGMMKPPKPIGKAPISGTDEPEPGDEDVDFDDGGITDKDWEDEPDDIDPEDLEAIGFKPDDEEQQLRNEPEIPAVSKPAVSKGPKQKQLFSKPEEETPSSTDPNYFPLRPDGKVDLSALRKHWGGVAEIPREIRSKAIAHNKKVGAKKSPSAKTEKKSPAERFEVLVKQIKDPGKKKELRKHWDRLKTMTGKVDPDDVDHYFKAIMRAAAEEAIKEQEPLPDVQFAHYNLAGQLLRDDVFITRCKRGDIPLNEMKDFYVNLLRNR